MKIDTLEIALKRIAKLEHENEALRQENETLKNRKTSGRKTHNEKWMGIYNEFVKLYEGGCSVVEIAGKTGLSERSIYRYKAYYEKWNESQNL